MPIITGDLLTDPLAQSFISLADAVAYLMPEQHPAWELAGNTAREAALVRASRWLVSAHAFRPLDAAGLARAGHVAARLAAETVGDAGVNLFAGTDTAAQVQSERVGSVAITYREGLKADAAGRAWPWLAPMLTGLVRPRGLGIGVMVI